MVNNLKTKILISNDIILPEGISIDIIKGAAYIESYKVLIKVNAR